MGRLRGVLGGDEEVGKCGECTALRVQVCNCC